MALSIPLDPLCITTVSYLFKVSSKDYPSLTLIILYWLVPAPFSVIVTNDAANLIRPIGSSITLTCTIKFGSAVRAAEVPLLMVSAQLSRDGTPLTLTGPTVSRIAVTYTRRFESFGRSNSGNYTCTAVVEPNQRQAPYLTENLNAILTSDSIQVTTGW